MTILSFIDGRLGKLDEWYFRYDRFVNRHSPPLFHGGWGSADALNAVVAGWDSNSTRSPIEIDWESAWHATRYGFQQRCGSFQTPMYVKYLPAESAQAHFRFVRPSLKGREPVVILMPTSREAGTAKRMPLAAALAKRGIASLLLESPFMGRRKPAEQSGTTLRYFSDFLVLAASSIAEGRHALDWLGRQGFDRLCCAGISQGGYLASVAGMRSRVPAHIVALLPPHSGVPVLLDGLIGQLCDWDLLQATSGSSISVREQMRELFDMTSLEQLVPSCPRQRVTVIGACRDRYVPTASYEKIGEAWRDHAAIQWLPGGHVSSIVERRHILQAILASFIDD